MNKSDGNNYIFHNPGFVKVRKRVSEQSDILKTDSNTWSWEDCGKKGEIFWDSLNISVNLKEALKGFVFHRIQTRSLSTISRQDNSFIRFMTTVSNQYNFPWSKENTIEILGSAVKKERTIAIAFRVFYQWCFKMNIRGFSKSIFSLLSEEKIPSLNPYQTIFLNPKYLTSEDESLILKYLDEDFDMDNYISYRDRIILQLAFELAPRASQIHSLEETDFGIIQGQSIDTTYYCLELPMAKKIGNVAIEKRSRKITTEFGKRLQAFILFTNQRYSDRKNTALFINADTQKRLSSIEISSIIIKHFNDLNLSEYANLTTLRHHLAQSLADQGACAEIIAEILGHNSTLPARAYLAATPEIAKIKTRALGKNDTYARINKMLMTGNIIERDNTQKERWVKGMVGSQYIGGIGSCGLSENTACPKNPLYSCYTCNKFHPFKDGSHQEVKTGLQRQAQLFIDIAQKGMSLEHNRPVLQLERTIEAVNEVINRIEKHGNE